MRVGNVTTLDDGVMALACQMIVLARIVALSVRLLVVPGGLEKHLRC